MTPEERATAQRLTQGLDAGVSGPAPMGHYREGIDPSLEFRNRILPGLFAVDAEPTRPGETGLPAASMTSGLGGMGIYWGTASPRPRGSERVSFIPSLEMDAALARAEQFLRTPRTQRGQGLPRPSVLLSPKSLTASD